MSADPITPLATDFDAPDESRWRDLAQAALKGAPFERLTTKTPDGVTIAPLYRAPDVNAPAAGLVQQALAGRSPHLPWDIRQPFDAADAATLNALILEDLQGGVSSVEILVGDGDGRGLADPAALRAALEGVMLDVAPIALNGGRRGLEAAQALAALLPAGAAPAFNLDPIGAWLARGAAPSPLTAEVDAAVALAKDLSARFPKGTVLMVSAPRCGHEAGGSPGQELALLLAAAAEYLRAGVEPQTLAAMALTRFSVGPDVVVEMAKLRAARLLWANLMGACGAPEAPMRLQAVTGRRMLTRDDAWTNILRGTAACFAASAGGADIITVLPFTAPLGAASPLARRMARNTQIILMEECRLGHVTDPGGGAFAVEALTQSLAEEAWGVFQEIERQGGLIAAAKAGTIQADIAKTAQARAKLVTSRRLPLTGVSDFPLLEETTPETAPAPPPQSPFIALDHDPITPLAWLRLSEPFETLRDAAKGKNAQVFFANLGPLVEFSPRANFAMNLFAAGGVAALGPDTVYADHAAMAAAFKASGARVAVLTGSDTRYAADSLDAATALKAAGCDWLIHAGKPADEQAVRAKGFDQFIFAGQDAVEALKLLHTALGIG
jgi:methylmalonyl-CoA mutase